MLNLVIARIPIRIRLIGYRYWLLQTIWFYRMPLHSNPTWPFVIQWMHAWMNEWILFPVRKNWKIEKEFAYATLSRMDDARPSTLAPKSEPCDRNRLRGGTTASQRPTTTAAPAVTTIKALDGVVAQWQRRGWSTVACGDWRPAITRPDGTAHSRLTASTCREKLTTPVGQVHRADRMLQ